jgi:hypothetical protein
MKEDSILVIIKAVVDLLVPEDSAIRRRNVHEFKPECVTNKVICKYGCSLQAGICPFLRVGMGNV